MSQVAAEINRVWAKICGGHAEPVTDEALLVKRVKLIEAQLECAAANFRATNQAYCKLDRETRELLGGRFVAPDVGWLTELETLEAKATPGPWAVYTSNSWRRIGRRDVYAQVLAPIVLRDGHPELTGPNRDADLDLLIAARNVVPIIIKLAQIANGAASAPREGAGSQAGPAQNGEPAEPPSIAANGDLLRELASRFAPGCIRPGDTLQMEPFTHAELSAIQDALLAAISTRSSTREPSTFHAVRELKARESGTQLASELAVLLRIADDQSLTASDEHNVAEEIWRKFRDSRENMEGDEVDLFVAAVAPYLPAYGAATIRRCTCYVLPHADDCEIFVGLTQSGERVEERRSGNDRRATPAETAEERRLRHRLEKIDAALDELGAPKTGQVEGLTMELSRVGRIRAIAAPSTTAPEDEISAELERAVAKFPTWPTDPLHALAVLGEEFGELTKAMVQLTYEPHKTSHDEVRMEALQTAAMALRLFRSLGRYEYRRGEQHEQR